MGDASLQEIIDKKYLILCTNPSIIRLLCTLVHNVCVCLLFVSFCGYISNVYKTPSKILFRVWCLCFVLRLHFIEIKVMNLFARSLRFVT